MRLFPILLACAMLVGCSSMPYRPAQADGAFPGLVDFVATAPGRSVDVLLVHGMCTHDVRWADATVAQLGGALKAQTISASRTAAADGIEIAERTIALRQGELRVKALIWSPLTSPLKRQLDYDRSDRLPLVRAKLNARAKDLLMNDCLPDALIYQGVSRDAIQQRMAQAIQRATAGAAPDAPLLVLSSSLGSKILFDTLLRMAREAQPTIERLAYLVMAANQIPLLALADQQAVGAAGALAAPVPDSLQALLRKRRAPASPRSAQQLTLVAFSDPNDLLTYTLERERYAGLGVNVVNVLVSNAPTWFGLVERPDRAHAHYLFNPDVARMAACGQPRSARCE